MSLEEEEDIIITVNILLVIYYLQNFKIATLNNRMVLAAVAYRILVA